MGIRSSFHNSEESRPEPPSARKVASTDRRQPAPVKSPPVQRARRSDEAGGLDPLTTVLLADAVTDRTPPASSACDGVSSSGGVVCDTGTDSCGGGTDF